MGWFVFRKTFRFGPFHLNLSRHGLGVSVGARGVRVGRNAKGRVYGSLSRSGARIQKYLPKKKARS